MGGAIGVEQVAQLRAEYETHKDKDDQELLNHLQTLMNTVKPMKLIIAGPPASGKGTQCEFIRVKFNLVHLSTGDMLRAAAAKETETGVFAKTFMDKGELVPDEVMIKIILERLSEADCVTQGWLLDGFPRTKAQAEALIANDIHCDAFVSLEVPDADLIERVVGRRSDPETGKIYHVKYSPPEDDAIRDRLVQRDDDTEEKVGVRIKHFHENNTQLLELYHEKVCAVQGGNDKSKTEIWEQLEPRLDEIFKAKLTAK
jgi:adenylate kinase